MVSTLRVEVRVDLFMENQVLAVPLGVLARKPRRGGVWLVH